jgi:GntR family transcriptional regulator
MAYPMHRRIAEDLRKQIESGKLEPGQQLPTEQELREQYDASRNTVRDAVKWLTCLGLAESRPGQGTFVADRVEPFVTTLVSDARTAWDGVADSGYLSKLEESGMKPSSGPVQVEIHETTEEIVVGVWVSRGSEVISRHERRFIDSPPPWSMQGSFYPMGFADREAERTRSSYSAYEGMWRYLVSVLCAHQDDSRDRITVRAPNESETGLFKLSRASQATVPRILSTAFDQPDRPSHPCGSSSPCTSLTGTNSSLRSGTQRSRDAGALAQRPGPARC